MKNNAYGQLVPVNGKHKNVEIKGDGKQVIILLPGRGYGLSDETGEERTVENIVEELHAS